MFGLGPGLQTTECQRAIFDVRVRVTVRFTVRVRVSARGLHLTLETGL